MRRAIATVQSETHTHNLGAEHQIQQYIISTPSLAIKFCLFISVPNADYTAKIILAVVIWDSFTMFSCYNVYVNSLTRAYKFDLQANRS